MTSIKALLHKASGDIELTEAVSFDYVRERYTPYTFFAGVFKGSCIPEEIRSVHFYCGGKAVHYGIADSIVCERKNGASLIRIKSYGFSMLLGQNQSEPGIISQPNLGTIIGRNLPITNVGYESGTKTVNYVYINERTTIWDAICVYAMKAYGTYPYIYSTNVVRCNRYGSSLFNYSGKKIVSVSMGQKLTNLISHGYTEDAEGNWTYSMVNDFAVARYITKQKYFARDKEWVYDLNDEIKYKLNNADRGRVYSEFCYFGYSGEELLDHASVSADGLTLTNAEIDRIEISGSSKGVFTTISSYKDSYCPQ